VAVKVQACYSAAFLALQLICHLLDKRLPLSRAGRIQFRHAAIAVLLALTIVVSIDCMADAAAAAADLADDCANTVLYCTFYFALNAICFATYAYYSLSAVAACDSQVRAGPYCCEIT
jgi:hypothetical protein